MKRVLITKLSSMGDLVHVMPALSDATLAIPGIEFDWVVDQSFKEVPLWHPSVHNLFITNHRAWRKNITSKTTWQEGISFYKELKKQKYDLIIDAQGNIKSALISLIAQGKKAGWDASSVPEWGSHFFYSSRYPASGCFASKKLHAIEKLRMLFAHALDYPLPSTPIFYGLDQTKFTLPSFPLPKDKYLLFVPIASYGSKLWQESHWQELIAKTTQKGYTVFIPWGNIKEKKRAERLAISSQVIVLPRLSLNEIAFLITKAHAMVSLDTGLSHIAAALNIPNITLYGPTDPIITGTLGENQTWVQSPFPCPKNCKKSCFIEKTNPRCLHLISPEMVWEKLANLL